MVIEPWFWDEREADRDNGTGDDEYHEPSMQELLDEPDLTLPEGVAWSWIYGDDTCLECVKCGTGNCEPLLEWLDSYYNKSLDEHEPAPYDSTCEEFVLSPYISSSEANEGVN